MPEPMVLVDAAVATPPDRLFWTTEDMFDPERWWPSWTTGEVGMTFFAVSKHTILRHMKEGFGQSPATGEVLPLRRPGGVERYAWRLWDVERFAHALAANGRIRGHKLARAVLMVKTCAELHGYL